MPAGVNTMRVAYANVAASLSASGVSAPFETGDLKAALLTCFVRNAPTGTTPSLTVQLEQLDACGNYLAVVQLAAQTAIGALLAPVGIAYPLTYMAQIRWTITGTTPVFPSVDIGLVGRI